MKTIYFFLLLLLSVSVQSQQNSKNNDIIVLSNGQLIQAQVTRVSDDVINFQYPGETVQNEINVGNLDKIVFASGRTQKFSSSGMVNGNNSQMSSSVRQTESRPSTQPNEVQTQISETVGTYKSDEVYLLPSFEKNSIAVLPFNFVENGQYASELAGESTNYATNYISQQAEKYGLNVQNINTTVKQLMSAQIDLDVLSATPAKKLLQISNTEYIIKVNINEHSSRAVKAQNNYSLQGYFGKEKSKKPEKLNKPSGDGVMIDFEVYHAEKNEPIYSISLNENRKPLSEKELSTVMPQWKFALTYVINGFLSTQK